MQERPPPSSAWSPRARRPCTPTGSSVVLPSPRLARSPGVSQVRALACSGQCHHLLCPQLPLSG